MDESKRQKVEALRERLSPEKRALLARRLAGAAAPLAGTAAGQDAADDRASEAAPPAGSAAPESPGAAVEAAVAAAVAAAVTDAPSEQVMAEELAAWRADDAHAMRLVCQVLAGLGYRIGDSCADSDLAAKIGSRPLYTKLLSRWVMELSAAGVLARRGEGLELSARLAEVIDPVLGQTAGQAAGHTPGHAPAGAPPPYWPQTSEQLRAVLRGEQHILELMERAGGVFENVKAYHRDTGRSRYFNAIVAGAVQAYARAAGGHLRILELGAGVGGTTGPVLDVLPAGRATYEFTDLSDAFFDFARGEFAHHRGVRYRTLDMNRPPSGQGFEEDGFDIVLASNALHCAKDLQTTSRWLRGLLRADGMLVIRELTTPRPAHMIIPGLIPGFSDFSDERLANHTPLLSRDAWRHVLESSGFDSVAAFPSGGACEVLGEHVIIAWRAPRRAVEEKR